jgi:hypothetical protein
LAPGLNRDSGDRNGDMSGDVLGLRSPTVAFALSVTAFSMPGDSSFLGDSGDTGDDTDCWLGDNR